MGHVSEVHLHPPECLNHVGHVAHELMHVLGFVHEHQRPDRDIYINIHWDRIRKGHENNFCPVVVDPLGLPYDAASVLHYGPWAFASGSDPTITPRHSTLNGIYLMGQRRNLSRTDIARINRLYGCEGYYMGDDLPGAIPYIVWNNRTQSLLMS